MARVTGRTPKILPHKGTPQTDTSTKIGEVPSETKTKSKTGGIYADGISALNTSMPKISPEVSMPTISPKVVSPQLGVVGGGRTGGATYEREITGGMGVTKLPSINPSITPKVSPEITNSTSPKYGDIISQLKTKTGRTDTPTSNNIVSKLIERLTGKTPKILPHKGTPKPDTSTKIGEVSQTTDTGANTDTSATEETANPVSYEEYLEQQRELLEQRKEEADRQAEAAKERAAVDAQASYAQNAATYGTNAEALARMGLQGGGYSDYLNAQAYAQKRADVQQANVTEQAAKAQNTATYEDALAGLNKSEIEYKERQQEKADAEAKAAEEKKDSIYASLWEGALNPNSGYTAESVAAIGRQYGLSETQITELQKIAADTKAKSDSEKQAAIKQGALDAINSGSVTESNINPWLDSLKGQGATDADIAAIRETYQSDYYNEYMSQITSGDTEFSTKAVDDAYNAGNLSKEHYESLKKAWNDDIHPELLDKYNYAEAKQYYENVTQNSWCSAEKKAELKKAFEQYGMDYYKSTKSSGTGITCGNSITMRTPEGKHLITIAAFWNRVDSYKNDAQKSMVQNADVGQFFVYNNKVYIKVESGGLGLVMDYAGDGAFEALLKTYKDSPYNLDNVK